MEGENNKNLVLIILVVAIVATIVGGVVAYVVLNSNKPADITETNTENVQQVEETDEEEKTNTNTSSNEATVDTNTEINTTTEETDNNTTTTNVNGKESTLEKPLALGEWGIASKRVSNVVSEKYKDIKSVDVPISVTKVTRGSEAEKIVKEWFDGQRLYKYEEPKETMEWAVVDYKVDLSSLTFDEGKIGANIDIYSTVKGIAGGGIKHNGISYIVTTKDISTDERAKKPGIYEGKFFVALPIGGTDYVIKLGDSTGDTEAFFKGE